MAESPAPNRSQWRIRSFSLRGSRLGARHEETVARHPELFVPLAPGPQATTVALDARCNLGQVFGRAAPLAVEIGPGSGEHGVSFAQRHPEYNVLLVEAWAPGAARCVASILRAGVTNVRVLEADAAQALPVLFGLECAGLVRGEDVTTCGPARSATHPNAANPRVEQVWTFFPIPGAKPATTSAAWWPRLLPRWWPGCSGKEARGGWPRIGIITPGRCATSSKHPRTSRIRTPVNARTPRIPPRSAAVSHRGGKNGF